MVRRLADTLADTALPADVLAEMERLNGEAAPLHLGLPPSFPQPVVPRSSHRETPETSASRILGGMSRPRLAVPRLAARGGRRRRHAAEGAGRKGRLDFLYVLPAVGPGLVDGSFLRLLMDTDVTPTL